MDKSDWQNSVFLTSVDDIKKLKNSEGSDLQVHGSGNLIQTLLKHDLVDELWLKTFPVTLGNGKRLFREGTLPAAFIVTERLVTPNGVIFAITSEPEKSRQALLELKAANLLLILQIR